MGNRVFDHAKDALKEATNSTDKIDLIVPSHFHQGNILSRIIKFCAKTDDVFFYGLHRTENIKKCSSSIYVWGTPPCGSCRG